MPDFYVVLGLEPRAWCTLTKQTTTLPTELHLQNDVPRHMLGWSELRWQLLDGASAV